MAKRQPKKLVIKDVSEEKTDDLQSQTAEEVVHEANISSRREFTDAQRKSLARVYLYLLELREKRGE